MNKGWQKLMVWVPIGLVMILWCVLSYRLVVQLTDFRTALLGFGGSLTISCGMLFLGHAIGVVVLPGELGKLLWGTLVVGILGAAVAAFRMATAESGLLEVASGAQVQIPGGPAVRLVYATTLPDKRLCNKVEEVSNALRGKGLDGDPVALLAAVAGPNGLNAEQVRKLAGACAMAGADRSSDPECAGDELSQPDCAWFKWLKDVGKGKGISNFANILDRRPFAVLSVGSPPRTVGVAPGSEVADTFEVRYVVAPSRHDGQAPYRSAVLIARKQAPVGAAGS